MSFSQMGCEALKPFTADKLPLNPDTKAQQIKLQDSAFKDLQNTPPISKIIKPSIELYPGTDHFVAESVHQQWGLSFDKADT